MKKRTKPDFEFKSYVLNNYTDIFDLVKKFYKLYYHASRDESYYDSFEAVSLEMQEAYKQIPEVINEIEKIIAADRQRLARARRRIAYMLRDGKCYFLTLTFKDEVLQNTSAETRRKYVTNFLKAISTMYFANIDFGAQNGREHYHAIIRTDLEISRHNWTDWKYGFASAKRIGAKDTDFKKVSRYICKLANHAVKATTQRNHAIYSRLPVGWDSTDIPEIETTEEEIVEILEEEISTLHGLDKCNVLSTEKIQPIKILQQPNTYG